MEVKKTTVEKVRELAQPIADELGFFLWDVRFEKGGSNVVPQGAYRQGRRHRYGRLRGFHKTDEQGA